MLNTLEFRRLHAIIRHVVPPNRYTYSAVHCPVSAKAGCMESIINSRACGDAVIPLVPGRRRHLQYRGCNPCRFMRMLYDGGISIPPFLKSGLDLLILDRDLFLNAARIESYHGRLPSAINRILTKMGICSMRMCGHGYQHRVSSRTFRLVLSLGRSIHVNPFLPPIAQNCKVLGHVVGLVAYCRWPSIFRAQTDCLIVIFNVRCWSKHGDA